MKASRSSSETIAPPASDIRLRQTTIGSRVTSAAARSALSSVALPHSISAVRTGISGSGRRAAWVISTRIASAVR